MLPATAAPASRVLPARNRRVPPEQPAARERRAPPEPPARVERPARPAAAERPAPRERRRQPRGTTGSAGTTGAAGANGDPAGYVPALVGVGYGGIRIVSRDGGKTWGDRAYETTSGGDDDVLLRAVVYGKGIWVATGWKLWTSTDGVKWTDHGKLKDGPVKSCAIIEGLAYKDGTFYGVCDGNVFRSTDGLTWTKHSTIPNTGSHVSLVYRGGKFVAYGDTKTSYQSDDALTWTTMAGIEQATYCKNTWKSEDRLQGLVLVRRRVPARRLAGEDRAVDQRHELLDRLQRRPEEHAVPEPGDRGGVEWRLASRRSFPRHVCSGPR